jgi:lipocalin-like protein
MKDDSSAKPFLGVWRLQAIRDQLPDGRFEDHPDLGAAVDGFLIYTASGHVSVQFMRRERETWHREDEPTSAERARAVEEYGAYAGRFDVDEKAGEVLHHVETALIPNRVGRTLTRFFSFSENSLTLASPPFNRRGTQVRRALTWKREGPTE